MPDEQVPFTDRPSIAQSHASTSVYTEMLSRFEDMSKEDGESTQKSDGRKCGSTAERTHQTPCGGDFPGHHLATAEGRDIRMP